MAEAKTAKTTKPRRSKKEVGVPTKTSGEAPKASKKAPKASNGVYAVISTGGKQYRVSEGQRVKIEKVLGDHKEGDTLVFREVLLKGEGNEVSLGTPSVSGASVHSVITKISRYKTVDVIKYKQKSRYFKKYGHRQPYFEVRIDSIK